jgi:tetratricopeptide (TPR) repeat protein
LFVWPVTLNSDNLTFGFSTGLDDWRVWAAAAVHATIFTLAWRAGRRAPFVLFAVAWMYITVSPASSVFPLVEPVNEHRMYIPYMMLAPLAAWLMIAGVLRGARAFGYSARFGRNAAAATLVVAAVALGAGAYARNQVWQTEVSLWEDVYSKNPDSPRALNVLGISLLNAGEFERGLPLLERCHLLSPNYLPCMVHLGIGYAHFKRYDEGLAVLKRGFELAPDYPHINYHLALYYKDYLGRPDEAIPHLERVIRVTEGRFFAASIKLAEVYIDKRELGRASQVAQAVLKLDSSNADAWDMLARAELLGGRLDQAERIVSRLVSTLPDVTRYYYDYAHVAELRRDPGKALKLYATIAQREPDAIQAHLGVWRTARAVGDLETAQRASVAIDKLKTSAQWRFISSLALPGEKPGQLAP